MDKRLSLCLVKCALFAALLYFDARFFCRDEADFVLRNFLISRFLIHEALHGKPLLSSGIVNRFQGQVCVLRSD